MKPLEGVRSFFSSLFRTVNPNNNKLLWILLIVGLFKGRKLYSTVRNWFSVAHSKQASDANYPVTNYREWNVDQVKQWLLSTGMKDIVEVVDNNRISGDTMESATSFITNPHDQRTYLKNLRELQGAPCDVFYSFFQNKQRLWIYTTRWFPAMQTESWKGIVLILHGMHEHILRYEHFAQALNEAGYAVFGLDHQGHGQSEGDRGHVENFQDYVDDVVTYATQLHDMFPDTLKFLFGHSLGGLMAALVGKDPRMQDIFNGVVLSSPCLAADPSLDTPLNRKIGPILANIVPKLRLPTLAINNDYLSHDPLIRYRVDRDPLHITLPVSIRSGNQVQLAFEGLMGSHEAPGGTVGQIAYPLFIFGGERDRLVQPAAWQDFFDRTSTPEEDKEIVVYPDLFHETLNEVAYMGENGAGRVAVTNNVIQWLDKRAGMADGRNTDGEAYDVTASADEH